MGKAPKITRFPRDRWDLHFYLNSTRSLVVSIPPIRTSNQDSSNISNPTLIPIPSDFPSQPVGMHLNTPVARLPVSPRTPHPPVFPSQTVGMHVNTPTPRLPASPRSPRTCEFFKSSSASSPFNPSTAMAQWHLTTVSDEPTATSPSLSRSPSRSVSPLQSTLAFNTGRNGNAASSVICPMPIPVASHSSVPRRLKKEPQRYMALPIEPYRQPTLKSFRGSQSHIKYAYYWTSSEYRLETPPAIPDDIHVSLGSLFVVKKRFGRKGLKITQSWLRGRQAGQDRWLPIQPETPVQFPHGDYVYSVDRSTPSWATPSSKKKQEWELKKKVAAGGSGKCKH